MQLYENGLSAQQKLLVQRQAPWHGVLSHPFAGPAVQRLHLLARAYRALFEKDGSKGLSLRFPEISACIVVHHSTPFHAATANLPAKLHARQAAACMQPGLQQVVIPLQPAVPQP